MNTSKTFVQYGAGNVGRGFIGPLFSGAGYHVQFIDVDEAVVTKLNIEKGYRVEIVKNSGSSYEIVQNVSAIDGKSNADVIEAIANAHIMATSIGANILPIISPLIAAGLQARWARGKHEPFNILLCENLLNGGRHLKCWVSDYLTDDEKGSLSSRVGFIEASIGRMIPMLSIEDKKRDPLLVRVEEYSKLPIDKDAIKGFFPYIPNIILASPFSQYIEKKLYVHNMSHSMAAYLGYLHGYEYIWQAMEDITIIYIIEKALDEIGQAMSLTHNTPYNEIYEHGRDLLERYKNRALADTVARVGGDTFRKLKAGDRLAGAAVFCLKAGVMPKHIAMGIGAALLYEGEPNDKGTANMRQMCTEKGLEHILINHCGINEYKFIHDEAKNFMSLYC